MELFERSGGVSDKLEIEILQMNEIEDERGEQYIIGDNKKNMEEYKLIGRNEEL